MLVGSIEGVDSILDRSVLKLARAPRSFWLDEILSAHREADAAGKHDYIDSASMMFEHGVSLTPVDGFDENIKGDHAERFLLAAGDSERPRERADLWNLVSQ